MLPPPTFILLSGGTAALYEAGNPDGPPLVFLPSYWVAAPVFRHQLASPMLQEFRLLICELPGQGQAPPTAIGLAPIELQNLLVELLHQLQLAQAIVVGHSYAGQWLLGALPLLPHLRGLVLAGTVPVSTAADIAVAATADERLGLFFSPHWTAQDAHSIAGACLRESASADELAEIGSYLSHSDGRARAALAAAVAADELADEKQALLETSVPILLLHGEQEWFWQLEYLQAVPAPSRRGPVRVVPQAAHLPFFEHPEAFNNLLLKFCRSVSL